MAHTPLVSVVMPVYNHDNYVVDAIRSVLEQNVRPLELIMIDDGSTDSSAKTINDYLASHAPPEGVTISFSSRENRGAHNTINEGLERAKGEYIAILNSDDLYMPGRLERCVSAAQAQRVRMVFTYVEPIDDDGKTLSHDHRWRSWYADVKMDELDIAPNLSTLLLRYNIAVSTGNLVFHRSVLDDIGYFHDFRYAHDIDFILRFCLLEEPVILREKLYRYRIHSSNTIAESNERATDEYTEIVRRYLSKAISGGAKNIFAPTFRNWPYSMAVMQWPPHLARAVDQLMAIPPKKGNSTANTAESNSAPPRGLKQAHTKTHLTLVSHELSYTGAPVLLRDIAMSLHDNGASTNVISLVDGPLKHDLEGIGSPVAPGSSFASGLVKAGGYLYGLSHDPRVPAPVRRLLGLSSKFSMQAGSLIRLLTLSRHTRGTLLINSFASWPMALLLLRRWKGPAYWYIHETFEPGLLMRNESAHQRLRRLIDKGTVKFLFGSDATRRVWAQEGIDGQVLYWSGIPSSEGLPAETDASANKMHAKSRRIVLSVQSSGTRKGTRPLIESFALGRRNGWIPDDVELRIIGCHPPSRNPTSRDLLCRVNEPDLVGAVSLVPTLAPAELKQHYQQADVYVQSSIMECLPLALLTAMAHGLPIVSTDADGCREAIIDNVTGCLVAQRQIEDMARAIGDLLADQTRANTLGKAARTRFEEKFSLEVTVPPLLETIAPVLLR